MKAEVTTKGQISVEYLIVIGVVLLLIVIPAAIFLTTFTQETVNQSVEQDQADRLGEGLVTAAEQVYYLGLYSQQTKTLPIPRHVKSVHALHLTQDEKTYHYIYVVTEQRGEQSNRFYQTRAPIINADAATSDNPDISECEEHVCETYALLAHAQPGRRDFELVHQPQGVKITVLS